MSEKIKRMLKLRWKTKTMIIAIMICCSIMAVSALVYTAVSTPDHVIEDNGYYEGTGDFDKEKTPVSNMLILLKIINGSNFCDDDWFKEVQEFQELLNNQIDKHRNSQDAYIKKMMDLQQNIEKQLRSFSTKAWLSMVSEKDVTNLQKAYDAYHDYYYENYGNGEAI